MLQKLSNLSKITVLVVTIGYIVFYLFVSQHSLQFQNNSGAEIATIKMQIGKETIEFRNVQVGQFVYFNFFSPFNKAAKIEIQSTKCGTKTETIVLKSEILFDYYHQMQLWENCQFDIGELYLSDKKLLNK